ncbi:hypothetical protein CHARACLAT_007690 [Characodon lateralis]|uniref:Uncharacterized protein n=1 Tax=Characodon lateralis TaxID=208331 RepID=A0ABU7CVT8_9TELE|nr:hypothetical protein [Characodon lateralis]
MIIKPAEANCVPEKFLQRRCLYEAERSGFPGLERGQPRQHHRGNVQLGRPNSEPPRPSEVSWKLTLCSQSFLQTSSSPGQLLLSMVHMRLGVWAEK